jgi:hypothetical protein
MKSPPLEIATHKIHIKPPTNPIMDYEEFIQLRLLVAMLYPQFTKGFTP